MAFAYQRNNQHIDSIKCFEKAVGIHKSIIGEDFKLSQILSHLATACLKNNQEDEAMHNFELSAMIMLELETQDSKISSKLDKIYLQLVGLYLRNG